MVQILWCRSRFYFDHSEHAMLCTDCIIMMSLSNHLFSKHVIQPACIGYIYNSQFTTRLVSMDHTSLIFSLLIFGNRIQPHIERNSRPDLEPFSAEADVYAWRCALPSGACQKRIRRYKKSKWHSMPGGCHH